MSKYINGTDIKEGDHVVVNDIDGGQFLAGRIGLIRGMLVLVSGCDEYKLRPTMEIVMAQDAFSAYETMTGPSREGPL